jgi:hypothetical protein
MAAYVAALFGVELLRRKSFLSGLKYFLAFNFSPAHPPFASYNHVLAKHS